MLKSKMIVICYSNSWAVEVTGGKGKADEIAERRGFINLGAVSMTMIFFVHTNYYFYYIDWFIK